VAAGPSISDVLKYVQLVWGTWQGRLGTVTAVLTGAVTVIKWITKWKVSDSWLPLTIRTIAVISVVILLAAPFGLWWQQGRELATARDSLGIMVQRSDSLGAVVESLKAAGVGATSRAAAARRLGIIQRLGMLIEEGNSIKGTALNGPYRPVDDLARWKAKVRVYLRASLGEGYVTRFEQAGPSDGFFEGVKVALMALWNDVDGKQACLTEFIKELQSSAR
jgi:hypothetical protein